MKKNEYKSPVYQIKRIPIEKIVPNDYNPNHVARSEMHLLYDSIYHDGYTMPIVCYYDDVKDQYVIVDGFHRWQVCRDYREIYEREGGCLPVSVIDKPLDQRMASTIRHNRARGSHNVDLMVNIIKELQMLGRSDEWITEHLGMNRNELMRLKQVNGLASLYKGKEFSNAWSVEEDEEEVA